MGWVKNNRIFLENLPNFFIFCVLTFSRKKKWNFLDWKFCLLEIFWEFSSNILGSFYWFHSCPYGGWGWGNILDAHAMAGCAWCETPAWLRGGGEGGAGDIIDNCRQTINISFRKRALSMACRIMSNFWVEEIHSPCVVVTRHASLDDMRGGWWLTSVGISEKSALRLVSAHTALDLKHSIPQDYSYMIFF